MKKGVSTGRKVCFVLFLLFVTVVLAGISTSLGSADLSMWDIYFAILHRFFPDHFESRWFAEVVVWNLRLPRILMGIGAGIALGLAGSMMQWALRNPLADPYTLGISSAAAFGTPLAIIFGRGSFVTELFVIGAILALTLIAAFIILGVSSRRWATPERVVLVGITLIIFFSTITIVVSAVSSGGGFEALSARLLKIFTAWNMTVTIAILIATSVILAASRRRLVTPERIVLAGVALILFFGAITIPLQFTGKPGVSYITPITLLILGDLGMSGNHISTASWDGVTSVYILLACCIPLLLLIFLLSLGGMSIRHIRILAMVAASLLVAIAVYFTGLIGFVGLMAPYFCRVAIGEDHRFVIPASGLFGAILLIGADIVARMVIAPVIVPVGVVTTLMGAPLFIYLLIKMTTKKVTAGDW